jgi:hypothetical protein
MRFDPTRRKHVVRWRDDGRQRTRRFDTPEEVEDVDEDRIGRSRSVVTSSTVLRSAAGPARRRR